MEAVLVKNKPKKQVKKSQKSSKTISDSLDEEVNCIYPVSSKESLLKDDSKISQHSSDAISASMDDNMNCTNLVPSEEEKPAKDISMVPDNCDRSSVCNAVKPTNNMHDESKRTDIHENDTNVSANQSKSKQICDKPADENFYTANEPANIETSSSENIVIKTQSNVLTDVLQVKDIIQEHERPVNSEAVLQHIYPDLKHIEQMQDIASSQALVKTYTEEYQAKMVIQANNGYLDFMKVITDVDKHPFKELIHQYQGARKSYNQLRSRLKHLKADLNRKNDSLWKSVTKKATAKGQCEDGYKVEIIHSYIIKELDQEKFYEIIKTLREIEDSVPKAAFNQYSEELMKLRVEQYILNLDSEENSSINSGIDSIKKCASILFNCQRQDLLDKSYMETCQLWLTKLISTVNLSGKFDENLFVINQILRCPNGIKNWASSFVQIPIDNCTADRSHNFNCACVQQILLTLFILLNPIPQREEFLKNIENIAFIHSSDASYTVLDSDGEEDEISQMTKRWSDDDILSLLKQVPLTRLFKHLLLDSTTNGESTIQLNSEEKVLKLFAYANVVIDVLFSAFKTYSHEEYPKLFEFISNNVRHILLYLSDYWINDVNRNDCFKSQIQAIYEQLVFHVVFKTCSFEKFGVWKILPSIPYKFISKKMLWNIMWIFYVESGKCEKDVYIEKDVERKIKDDCVQNNCIKQLKKCSPRSVIYLLNTFEVITLSSNSEVDLLKFIVLQIYKIAFVETELRDNLHNEGATVLVSIIFSHPHLVSVLIKEVDENEKDITELTTKLFKNLNLKNWIPEDGDISIISTWLLSNPLQGIKNHLARLLLRNLNWGFKQGSLFLPYEFHQRIGLLVVEAYLKFDADSNEWMVSRGVKQLFQFVSVGNSQREDEGFIQWAWYIMFSLKLHPLDMNVPPWISIYDGDIEDSFKLRTVSDVSLAPLLSAFENNHPSACYLMLVMTEAGLSANHIKKTGLKCLFGLVQNQQYLAAIKSLYYILPFFVKNSEQLLLESEFLKAMGDLLTADMTIMSNLTGEPVIGAVLTEVANMIKFQIYQALDHTVECTTPLIKLWIKLLLKITQQDNGKSRKFYGKQVQYLLDVISKICFVHTYTRDCISDLLCSLCHNLFTPKHYSQTSFLKRMLYSSPSVYFILNQRTIPDYPWLAWFILSAELKQEYVQEIWAKVQDEMLKSHVLADLALKKVSDILKIDKPPAECLPIYRWALQAVNTPVHHPLYPLFWQQFFLYYFQRLSLPDSQGFVSLGKKYFQSGPQLSFFEKMKSHLMEAERYYKNCHKNLDSESSSPQDVKQADTKLDLQSHSKTLKVIEAFVLWINDDSLHNSELCLSALGPKYSSSLLELILRGDQTVWFDLVPVMHSKDDIDYKAGFWHNKADVCNTELNMNLKDEEPLPKKIQRHIQSYEIIEPLRNPEIVPKVFEVDEAMLSSWDTLGQIIEQMQNIIFKKAKCFTKQLKDLKQLNFNFINWVPQEYEVTDCEVTKEKVCHKGLECAGAASFKLKIQKYSKNERICKMINENRTDYLILQDKLSKLPVDDLCLATLQIENFIRILAEGMKSDKKEEVDHLKKMGITFFYHQIKTMNKLISSVAEYSPARQFFSSVIESLGREFIEGDDSQLLNLAKSILDHPKSGFLALPLFNPNKCSVSNFIGVYRALTSSIGNYSDSTLLALFSKIDFSLWLQENTLPFSCRREIFKLTCNALQLCGFAPSDEVLPIFEILKKHYRILLLHMFPELFSESVYFLLSGIENKICVDVYYETFHCFGCPLFNNETKIEDVENSLKKFAENQLLPANQKIFISLAQLNLKQVKTTCSLISQKFPTKQECSSIYKNEPDYIKPMAIFIALISHSLIALQLEENKTCGQVLSSSDLWKMFHLPFCSWLHPTVNGNSLAFPWADSEVPLAQYMFQIFIICLKFFQEQLLQHKSEESVLSYIWMYYVEAYVVPGHRHYLVSICHSEFIKLPWHQFQPTASDVEGMCKVLQSNLSESKEFLAKISLKIPWTKVLNDIVQTKSPDYVGKVLTTLGRLLIISQFNSSEESNLYPSILKDLENLPWHFQSLEDAEDLLNLFYSRCDPLLLLHCVQKNANVPAFQFLKSACCMVPAINSDEYSNCKRILFLQKFKSALNVSSINKNIVMSKAEEEFKAFLPILFDEIASICKDVSPSEQIKFAMPLVKEVMTLLNSFAADELLNLAIKSLTSWLSENPRSPLVLSCLKVSSSYLSSVVSMVPLIECCIAAQFSDGVHDSLEVSTTWALISSCFCVPSKFSKDFIQKCIEDNAFLSLYCYILHRQPHYTSNEQKKELFQLVFKWIRESDLSSEAEAKFLLLWDKLLHFSLVLVSQGDFQVVQHELTSFCWKLERLAEDRSSSGFLATFGLGQASSLSVNFRFLCRVLAAFLLCQIPDNCRLRIEPMDSGHISSVSSDKDIRDSQLNQTPVPTRQAITALDNLKSLHQKRSYAALQSHVDYAVKCVLDPNYNLTESRKLLKYFALLLFPKESYLSTLDS